MILLIIVNKLLNLQYTHQIPFITQLDIYLMFNQVLYSCDYKIAEEQKNYLDITIFNYLENLIKN